MNDLNTTNEWQLNSHYLTLEFIPSGCCQSFIESQMYRTYDILLKI